MLLMLAQIDPPKEVPATFGAWAVYALCLVTAGAIAYLINQVRDEAAAAKESMKATVDQLKDERQKAEDRLNKAWDSHEKDREAFLRHQEEVTQTLREIRSDVSEIRKNGDRR